MSVVVLWGEEVLSRDLSSKRSCFLFCSRRGLCVTFLEVGYDCSLGRGKRLGFDAFGLRFVAFGKERVVDCNLEEV